MFIEDIISFDGTPIRTYEFGNTDGWPIIFVHGFCQSYLSFKSLYGHPDLAKHRLISYDLRGHGYSGKQGQVSLYSESSTWVADLAAVLMAKSVVSPLMVGWSMGGRIVREYLLTAPPDSIRGVNFVSSQVIEHEKCRGPCSPKQFAETSSLEGDIQWARNFLRNCYHLLMPADEMEIAIAYNMLIPDEVRRATAQWRTAPAASIAGLQGINMPVLLSYGLEDKVVLPFAASLASEHLTGAQVSLYPDCGHSPFAEYPERFANELFVFAKACFGDED